MRTKGFTQKNQKKTLLRFPTNTDTELKKSTDHVQKKEEGVGKGKKSKKVTDFVCREYVGGKGNGGLRGGVLKRERLIPLVGI